MPELQGSKTESNLKTAFAGESQARNKYGFFSDTARKEGYEQIGWIFDDTANNEREHAEIFFSFLGGIGDTAANLRVAARGEHDEWTRIYPGFAETARREGFLEVADAFEEITTIERSHERRYDRLGYNLTHGLVFRRPRKVVWHCRNCGFLTRSDRAPDPCPVCGFPQAFFELKPHNY